MKKESRYFLRALKASQAELNYAWYVDLVQESRNIVDEKLGFYESSIKLFLGKCNLQFLIRGSMEFLEIN
jgi:hypothetical protein